MNRKKAWVGLAAAAMLATTLSSLAVAHNLDPASVNALGVPDGDSNVILAWDTSGAVSAGGHVDDDRMGASGDSAGVSGRYVGGGVYVGATGAFFPIEVDEENSLFPDGIEIFAGNALCDVEVLGPGNIQAPEDEPMVDSDLNAVWGAIQNEGDWDDGGFGGACHTTGYGRAQYNTPGCPSGADVNAEDAVSGPMIWIAATCDTLTVTPGENSTPDPQAFALCLVNEAIQDKDFARCVADFANCIDNAETCGDPSTISCGADNTADSNTFGRGQGHGPATVTYPLPGTDSNGNECSTAIGQAIVFTFTGVNVNVPADPTTITPNDVTVSAATAGWIETGVAPVALCGASTVSVNGAPSTHGADFDGTVEIVFTLGAGRILTGESVTQTGGPAGGSTNHADFLNTHTWETHGPDLEIREFTYSFTTACLLIGAPENFTDSYDQWN